MRGRSRARGRILPTRAVSPPGSAPNSIGGGPGEQRERQWELGGAAGASRESRGAPSACFFKVTEVVGRKEKRARGGEKKKKVDSETAGNFLPF